MEAIGERIYKLRKKAGISQEVLGQRIGVSRQAVSQWETNTLCPRSDKIKALCEIFNVNADYFLLAEKEFAAIAETQELETENNNEVCERSHTEGITKDKSRNRTKKLAIVFSGIISIIIIVFIALMGLCFSTSRGDYTTSSVTCGLTRTGMIILISIVTAVLLLITIIIFILLLKKRKK